MNTHTAAEVRQPVRFSPEEFYTLAEQDMIPEFSELVDGQIIEMPGQNFLAVFIIGRIYRHLLAAWHNPDAIVQHLTHPFSSNWNPLPDITVYDRLPPMHPRKGDFPPPRLVVEVSDTTLDYDAGDKAERYAAEGIEELWVADGQGGRLLVHRDALNGQWQTRLDLGGDDVVSPLCLPDLKLRVGDLFPPADA